MLQVESSVIKRLLRDLNVQVWNSWKMNLYNSERTVSYMLEKHQPKTTLWLHSGNGTFIYTPHAVENVRIFWKIRVL